MRKFRFFGLLLLLLSACNSLQQTEDLPLRLDFEPLGKSIAVTDRGELLALYHYSDTLFKPLFFPVNTVGGLTVTRGFPFDPRPGEPVDHPHQTGAWFTFGDVNGIDFWNNSHAIPPSEKNRYGHIIADSVIIDREEGNGCGFTAFNSWLTRDNKILMDEKASYVFESSGNYWIMKRKTVLTARRPIQLGDNKEGLFAIRLAREFQSDLDKPAVILGPDLYPLDHKTVSNEGKQGYFFASNGKEGHDVWGTAGKWVAVSTIKDGDSVSVVMFDHPQNPGFPSRWHARDYGLFSVNNLGQKSYIDTLPAISTTIPSGDSIVFIHELIVKSSGFITRQAIDSLYASFASDN